MVEINRYAVGHNAADGKPASPAEHSSSDSAGTSVFTEQTATTNHGERATATTAAATEFW